MGVQGRGWGERGSGVVWCECVFVIETVSMTVSVTVAVTAVVAVMPQQAKC